MSEKYIQNKIDEITLPEEHLKERNRQFEEKEAQEQKRSFGVDSIVRRVRDEELKVIDKNLYLKDIKRLRLEIQEILNNRKVSSSVSEWYSSTISKKEESLSNLVVKKDEFERILDHLKKNPSEVQERIQEKKEELISKINLIEEEILDLFKKDSLISDMFLDKFDKIKIERSNKSKLEHLWQLRKKIKFEIEFREASINRKKEIREIAKEKVEAKAIKDIENVATKAVYEELKKMDINTNNLGIEVFDDEEISREEYREEGQGEDIGQELKLSQHPKSVSTKKGVAKKDDLVLNLKDNEINQAIDLEELENEEDVIEVIDAISEEVQVPIDSDAVEEEVAEVIVKTKEDESGGDDSANVVKDDVVDGVENNFVEENKEVPDVLNTNEDYEQQLYKEEIEVREQEEESIFDELKLISLDDFKRLSLREKREYLSDLKKDGVKINNVFSELVLINNRESGKYLKLKTIQNKLSDLNNVYRQEFKQKYIELGLSESDVARIYQFTGSGLNTKEINYIETFKGNISKNLTKIFHILKISNSIEGLGYKEAGKVYEKTPEDFKKNDYDMVTFVELKTGKYQDGLKRLLGISNFRTVEKNGDIIRVRDASLLGNKKVDVLLDLGNEPKIGISGNSVKNSWGIKGIWHIPKPGIILNKDNISKAKVFLNRNK